VADWGRIFGAEHIYPENEWVHGFCPAGFTLARDAYEPAMLEHDSKAFKEPSTKTVHPHKPL